MQKLERRLVLGGLLMAPAIVRAQSLMPRSMSIFQPTRFVATFILLGEIDDGKFMTELPWIDAVDRVRLREFLAKQAPWLSADRAQMTEVRIVGE